MRQAAPWLVSLAVVLAGAAPAVAKPKPTPKRYYFKLADVTAAPAVAKDVAEMGVPRVLAQAQKAFGEHPQLVVFHDGDPDPAAAAAFSKWLAKQKLASGHKVSIQVTDATEEIEQVLEKANTQRIVVHVELHMFSETMPQRKMGFTGDGSSTIKLEIGKKVRLRDRQEAWDEAATEAVNKALEESLTVLSTPPPKPHK